MQLHDVLIRPVITEKSTKLMEENKYTFRVPRVLGKTKRMGRTQGKRSDYKKAIVTLKAGESIEFFEGV